MNELPGCIQMYSPISSKLHVRQLSLLLFAFGLTPVFADMITPATGTNINLNETQRDWTEPFPFVSGMLILCNGIPRNTLTGPCTDGASDVIIFDNADHEAIFFSNSADGGGDPADIPFTGHLNLINARFVFGQTAVSGDTFVWAPGPNDPGFYGAGNTWTISDNPISANAEPTTMLLLGTALVILAKLAHRSSFRPSAPR